MIHWNFYIFNLDKYDPLRLQHDQSKQMIYWNFYIINLDKCDPLGLQHDQSK